jgi:hypothetical protein
VVRYIIDKYIKMLKILDTVFQVVIKKKFWEQKIFLVYNIDSLTHL